MLMENEGFTGERETTQHQQPCVPGLMTKESVVSVENGHVPASVCACEESQQLCGCGAPPPVAPRPKVEVRAWVSPKGWMLLGLAVGLAAWCTIYFTLSVLDLL